LHQGSGPGLSTQIIGTFGGSETVTLTTGQLPQHTHTPMAHSSNGSQLSPQNGVWSASAAARYTANQPITPMHPGLIGSAGGGQPHENMMPFVAINFIISLFGIFPSPA
jgi:microcystin-dependent protein